MTLGEKLRELRKQKQKTLRDVYNDLGINYSNLAQIERGEHSCNSETLKLLAQYYNVSTDYLNGIVDNPKAIKVKVFDADGTITECQQELIDATQGFTTDDFNELNKYIDFLKMKKEDTKK